MFGTIAMAKVKPGQIDALKAEMERWTRERGTQVRGFISTTIYQSTEDPNQLMMAVIFDSRESYMANAESPDQDKEYHAMLQHLEGPPTWHDGEIISHMTA
jgi:heme-degrading monooxygenase HmoA